MANVNMTDIIEYLQGTCNTLQEACEIFGIEEDDLTLDQLKEIDEEIFLCDGCGWWCCLSEEEVDDSDGGLGLRLCSDCFSEKFAEE